MSVPVFPERGARSRGSRRVRVRVVVAVARILTHVPPRAVVAVLRRACGAAEPSTVAQAQAARDLVCGASSRCAGLGCLQRAIATVLLCRTEGHVPGWRTGFRSDPFAAHAWVTVDGAPVGEPPDIEAFSVVLGVDPAPRGSDERQDHA